MKIIFINGKQGKSVALNFTTWVRVLLSVCVLGTPLGLGVALGLKAGASEDRALTDALDSLAAALAAQQKTLADNRANTAQKLAAYSRKLAEMQARVVRLDALGERIADVAGLNGGEFDFSRLPAVGGPDEMQALEVVQTDSGLEVFYGEMEALINDRERQLGLLRTMMADRQFKRESTVAGRPIEKGWMSSAYGVRRDPFHGKKAWHKGVDFAGRDGSAVIAVAAGIVSRAETQPGYGEMIEIDHGDTLVTRYAHNKQNLVNVGELVKKGQIIARMGSTGRSTGPHVHFEVYKHGRHVDPASYIRRTVR